MCLEEIIAELSVDENGLNIKNIEEKINSIENTMKTKQEKAEEFNSNLAQNSLNNQSDAKLEKYEDKIKEIIRKQDKLVEEEKELTEGFEEKKKMRLKLFMDFFEEIKRNIEEIYKQLTKSDKEFDLGGSVLLYLENNSEPFNGGVVYSPTPPHKRYVFDTEQLSGGEKTIGNFFFQIILEIIF